MNTLTLTAPKFQISQIVYDRYWLFEGEVCAPSDLDPEEILVAVQVTTSGTVIGLCHGHPQMSPGWSYHIHWSSRCENGQTAPYDIIDIIDETALSDR